jgi:hypothetical protein
MENKHQLQIDLKPNVKSIVKFGFVFQGVLIIISIPLLLVLGLQIKNDLPLLSLLPFAGALVFLYAGKKYLENVYYKESIRVSPTDLTVVIKKLGQSTQHSFSIKDITSFGYAGEEVFTKHPMHNDVIDFTGLATTERELQFLIAEGTLEIETAEQRFRFGKNMASWEAEEVIAQAERYLDSKFENKYSQPDAEDDNLPQ